MKIIYHLPICCKWIKIIDIRFNPIKFYLLSKKKLRQFRATEEEKKKDQWRCQPFGPHLPAKISFQSTLHPSTGSRRCNEIIFSFARPSLRFFCAGFLLNAGHKIVGYGRTITQTTSSRRRANIERERERGNAKKRGRKKRRRKRGAEGRQRAGKGSGEGERKDRWMKWVSAALRSWHKYQSRSSSSSRPDLCVCTRGEKEIGWL